MLVINIKLLEIPRNTLTALKWNSTPIRKDPIDDHETRKKNVYSVRLLPLQAYKLSSVS